MIAHRYFSEVWCVDFEFHAPPGERPQPICMVAREWYSGKTISLWGVELRSLSKSPFDVGNNALFVAYYASAEIGCFHALGWELPVNTTALS